MKEIAVGASMMLILVFHSLYSIPQAVEMVKLLNTEFEGGRHKIE
jgi:hypothetical protein